MRRFVPWAGLAVLNFPVGVLSAMAFLPEPYAGFFGTEWACVMYLFSVVVYPVALVAVACEFARQCLSGGGRTPPVGLVCVATSLVGWVAVMRAFP